MAHIIRDFARPAATLVAEIARFTPATLHEAQLESMYDVDRAVGSILDVVPTNTVVVYLSDNGMLWGEHRLIGKGVPYNESIRVPMP